jgi:hypothetical protein
MASKSSRVIKKVGACKVTHAIAFDNLESVSVSCPMYAPKDHEALIPLPQVSSDIRDNKVDYKKLPEIFTDKENWPKSTNLHCPNCTFKCKSYPIIIPKALSIDRTGRVKSMNVLESYAFNSIACANTFLQDKYKNHSKLWEYYENLRIWASLVTGKVPKELPTVDSFLCMEKYGGNRTKKQYMEKIKEIEKIIY